MYFSQQRCRKPLTSRTANSRTNNKLVALHVMQGPSRHEYGGRYDAYPSERRGYSGERDRHLASPYASRRDDFRKPLPPQSPRGGGRGRLSSRGSRGIRRERGGGPPRRRLGARSYAITKRGMLRSREFSGRTKLMRIRR